MQQRKYSDNQYPRSKHVNTSFPGDGGLQTGPLASSAGRTTNSQPDLAAQTGHAGTATSSSGVKQGASAGVAQYEGASEYYDEEADKEIETEIRQL